MCLYNYNGVYLFFLFILFDLFFFSFLSKAIGLRKFKGNEFN